MKKKQRKQWISLILAALLVLSFAGCGSDNATPQQSNDSESTGGDTGSSGTSQDNQSTADNTERVPIRWLTTGDTAAEVIQDDDRIIEEINNRLGIDLTVEFVPEGSVERINAQIASGDFPDIVTGALGTSATQGWIENGVVIPLDSYRASYPDIDAWLNEYSWADNNGSYYGIPFVTQYDSANSLIVMRQDWLDNLGLEYPKDLDEMKNVLTQFTFNDPDGNGQNDTYGYTGEGYSFDWVFYAYGREYADYALDENDNVIPVFEDDSFIPAMKYIKDLWDSGVIDPELTLNDASKKEEKFYQGKAGAMVATLYRHVARHENSLKALYPDAELAYDLAPKGPDGSFGLNAQGKGGFLTCITAACKNPDKAAEFINFMISEEGTNLVRLGIEGIHYTVEGDEIVFNEEERAKDAFSPDGWAHALAWGTFFWPLDSNYIPPTDPNRDRAVASVELATQCQVKNLIQQKTDVEIEMASTLNDLYTQYINDVLQGKVDIEAGAAQLSQEWRSQGGDKVLESLNEAYHAGQ